MAKLISQGSSSQKCSGVVFPYKTEGSVVFDATVAGEEGSTPLDLVTALTSGTQLAKGGIVNVNGCNDVLLTFTVWGGGDCLECTTEKLETKTFTETLKGGTGNVYELDPFYWSAVTATLVDSTGTPVNLGGTLTEDVSITSTYVEDCPSCIKYVP